jgi:glycosyltransferase involved in cell wall biosynthesis
LFDRDYYLTHNPDVREAGVDPLQHYLCYGWKEGRDPSSTFSSRLYLETNPDVAVAGINPLVHYLRNGRKEGRKLKPEHPYTDSIMRVEENMIGGEEGKKSFAVHRISHFERPEEVPGGENPPENDYTPELLIELSRNYFDSSVKLTQLQQEFPRVKRQLDQTQNELNAIRNDKWMKAFFKFRKGIARLSGKRGVFTGSSSGALKSALGKAHPAVTDPPPTVSVVIPIYDRTDILIESIESILHQTTTDYELLLICDGSPEDTLNIVRNYAQTHPRVRAFYFNDGPSGNAVRARNKGIREARGKYLAFHDSDDVADPDRLKNSLAAIEESGADVIYGGWRVLTDGTRYHELKAGQEIYPGECDLNRLLESCVPCQSTVMAKTSVLRDVGGLNPDLKYREDHELWLRLVHNGYRFFPVKKVLTNLRLHSNNLELVYKGDDAFYREKMLSVYKTNPQLKPKIGYVIPNTQISGGIAMVCQYANRLLAKGFDITLISIDDSLSIDWFPGQKVEILPLTGIETNYDILVATGWETARTVQELPSGRKFYFVQGQESSFYPPDQVETIKRVRQTYEMDFEFLAVAKWLQAWLKSDFNREAVFLPNGIDTDFFHRVPPIEPKSNKPRLLLEGSIAYPFKGMAEAFRAVEGLDCEVWCVSGVGRPEPGWHCDRFFERVPFHVMNHLYSSCDILLKMSHTEGFPLPGLEMMACGGMVVASRIPGFEEYMVDGYNGLLVPVHDHQAAREALARLIRDRSLRETLMRRGENTVKQWTWEYPINLLVELFTGHKTDPS